MLPGNKKNGVASGNICCLQTCKIILNIQKQRPLGHLSTINYRTTFQNFANKHHHPPIGDERDVLIDLSPGESGPWTRVDGTMVAGDVLGSFDTLKYKYARIHVCCIEPALQPTSDQTPAQPSALAALMNAAKEKIVPSKKAKRFVTSNIGACVFNKCSFGHLKQTLKFFKSLNLENRNLKAASAALITLRRWLKGWLKFNLGPRGIKSIP